MRRGGLWYQPRARRRRGLELGLDQLRRFAFEHRRRQLRHRQLGLEQHRHRRFEFCGQWWHVQWFGHVQQLEHQHVFRHQHVEQLGHRHVFGEQHVE
jgi:hypothetical protein